MHTHVPFAKSQILIQWDFGYRCANAKEWKQFAMEGNAESTFGRSLSLLLPDLKVISSFSLESEKFRTHPRRGLAIGVGLVLKCTIKAARSPKEVAARMYGLLADILDVASLANNSVACGGISGMPTRRPIGSSKPSPSSSMETFGAF